MGINGGESHSETVSCQVLNGDNVKKVSETRITVQKDGHPGREAMPA